MILKKQIIKSGSEGKTAAEAILEEMQNYFIETGLFALELKEPGRENITKYTLNHISSKYKMILEYAGYYGINVTHSTPGTTETQYISFQQSLNGSLTIDLVVGGNSFNLKIFNPLGYLSVHANCLYYKGIGPNLDGHIYSGYNEWGTGINDENISCIFSYSDDSITGSDAILYENPFIKVSGTQNVIGYAPDAVLVHMLNIPQTNHFIPFELEGILYHGTRLRNSRTGTAGKTVVAINSNNKGNRNPGTGWLETPSGTYYYQDGSKFTPSTGWLELGDEPNLKFYFLDKTKNWARTESSFKEIQSETYYFDKNGVMLTGRGHKIGDMYYDFDNSGRLVREHWGEPVIPSDYYFGTDEKKQIEYIFGTNPGMQSWSDFSASLANQVGKNIIMVEVPAWKFGENNNKIAYTKRLRIHEKVADVVVSIFTEIFNSSEQFVIDDVTTSGYNDRGNTTSLHNYGIAIDINWEANPWLTNEGGKKTNGEYRPGVDPLSIEATSSVVQVFKKYGWYWGAEWNSSKDYMHFAYMNH